MHRDYLKGFINPGKARVTHPAVWIGLVLASLLVGKSVVPAFAAPQPFLASARTSIQSSGLAGPTPAWIDFCNRQPQECAVDLSEPEMILLDQRSWDRINRVNTHVNRTILPVSDQDHWGVLDRWDYPDDGLGDCEDIQLLKRKLLVDAGLPRRAMRMTVVIDEDGAGHAVMMIHTSYGDFILDNKRNEVLAWQETSYRFVKREGMDGMEWVWLQNQTTPIVTAYR
jgi:predicted transglutaminase-like cysteine proteinase